MKPLNVGNVERKPEVKTIVTGYCNRCGRYRQIEVMKLTVSYNLTCECGCGVMSKFKVRTVTLS